jgi:hypothetical protein
MLCFAMLRANLQNEIGDTFQSHENSTEFNLKASLCLERLIVEKSQPIISTYFPAILAYTQRFALQSCLLVFTYRHD